MVEPITITKKEMDILWGNGNYDIEENGTIHVFRNTDVFAIGGFHRWLKRGTEDWKALEKGRELLKRGGLDFYERLLFMLYRIERKIFGDFLI